MVARLLLALVLVTVVLVPVGGSVAVGTARAATECTYGNGHFVGDCYFVNNPSSVGGGDFVCAVNYAAHTYTQGCLVTPFPPGTNSEYWSSTPDNARCDVVQGGYYCPGKQPPLPGHRPAPGMDCDYIPVNLQWDCWPAGPPADLADCTYATATGVDAALSCKPTPSYSPSPSPSASPSPSPSASPSGAPPCATTDNMVCNGDFESPGGVAPGEVGGWRQVPSCDSSSYEQTPDAHTGGGAALYVYPAFDEGPCGNPNRRIVNLVQRLRALPEGAVGRWHLSFWAKHPPRNGCTIIGRVSYVGADGPELNGSVCVGGEWQLVEFTSDLKTIYRYAASPVVAFDLLIATGDGYPYMMVDDVYLQFACEQNCNGVAPSPSPSPSPSASPTPSGPPAWTCGPVDASGNVRCTPPPGTQITSNDPVVGTCTLQPQGNYTCNGPAPPSPSPSPSGSPSGSPSPAPTPRPLGPSAGPSPGPTADGNKPCARAEQLLAARIAQGVPYCWGGRDPDASVTPSELCPQGHGLDCSGAVIWSYRQAGVDVPNMTAQDLYNQLPHTACTLADLDRSASDGGGCWAVGDLIFLAHGAVASDIYHVAGYAGGNLWTDCYSTASGCQVWDIRNKAPYTGDFVGAARPSLAWGGGQCGDGGTVAGGAAGGGAGTGPGSSVSLVGVGEIAAALQPLYNKEPVGTILDTANYMRQLKTAFTENVDTSPAISGGGSVTGTGADAALGFLNVSTFIGGTTWFLSWLADRLAATQYGPINALQLIRIPFDVGCVVMVISSVRRVLMAQ